MKLQFGSRSGLTLVEMMITTTLIGVLGLIIFSILSTGTSLGAKNTAVNTAHQQARSALLKMTQTIHSAVSAPQLIDANGNPTAVQPAAGVSFQVWAGGPYKVTADTGDAWKGVKVNVPDKPFTNGNQRLIIPGYQLEANIAVPSASTGAVTLVPTATPSPAPIPVPITVPAASPSPAPSTNCFITNRCSYVVVVPDPINDPNHGNLEWHYTDPATGKLAVTKLTSQIGAKPFQLSANGDVIVNLTAEDASQSNQDMRSAYGGFKSTKALLSETIPIRAKLTATP